MEPIIKVRYKEKILWTLLLIVHGTLGQISRCDKTPEDYKRVEKTPGSHGFSVSVSGSPRKYRPEQVYTIKLSGFREEGNAKFQDFLLVAQPAQGNNAIQSPTSLGTFSLVPTDPMTKFSHRCSHAVEATSSMNKEEITVYWTSPPKGHGCIDFKAMVVERADVWYMDDGDLTYAMCEDDAPLSEPQPVTPCCACDEAKYEAIFEGIWSRHTHPKDFPVDEWRTMFGELIGASHSANYSLWEYGAQASRPLQTLGEMGVTRHIESDMRRSSPFIRSVVKAHGLQQRSNVIGQTFAVFRVDPQKHLLSVVSKMIPSPDWIVGLSKENLCLANCSWVDNRVIDLYPWDIGTDSGLRYDGPPRPSRPKESIHRITSTNPVSDESPFYDLTGAPMKPAARLHLIKQREYRKQCAEGRHRPDQRPGAMNPSWNNPDAGLNGGGGGGGGDSYYYGNGIGANLQPENDYSSNSDYNDYNDYNVLENQESPNNYDNSNYDYNSQMPTGGYGPQPTSDYNNYGGGEPCEVTSYSQWSDCSTTCNSGSFKGSQTRTREYTDENAANNYGCSEELLEKRPCSNLPLCEPREPTGTFNPFEWTSSYSSGVYDNKFEIKNRLSGSSYLYDGSNSNAPNNMYQPSNQQYRGGYNNRVQRPSYSDNYGNSYTYGGNSNAQYVAQSPAQNLPQSQRLNAPMRDQGGSNQGGNFNCDVSEWGVWSDCSSKCDYGSRTRTRRYINPSSSMDCTEELDEFQPCRGNDANCPSPRGNPISPSVNNNDDNILSYYSQNTDDPGCRTSPWSDWSPCSNKCGSGYQRRTRLYMIPFVPNRSCDVRLYDKQDCYMQEPSCDAYSSFSNNNGVDEYEISSNQLLQDSRQDNNINGNLPDYSNNIDIAPPEICSVPKDSGICRSNLERWYFDIQSGYCKDFGYTGCGGNKNNFPTKEKCEQTCGQNSNQISSDYQPNYWSNNNAQVQEERPDWGQMEALNLVNNIQDPILVNAAQDLSSSNNNNNQDTPIRLETDPSVYDPCMGQNRRNRRCAFDPMISNDRKERLTRPLHNMDIEIDCQVSAWSTWSSCSKSCGTGWQQKSREILINPSIGGKNCPRKMERKKKCRQMPCPANTKYWYQGSWRHMVDPEDE